MGSRLRFFRAPLPTRATALNIYVAAVCGVGALLLVLFSKQGVDTTPVDAFAALIAASAVAEAFPIIVPWRNQRLYFSLGTIFGFALLILYGIPAAAVVHAALWFVVHVFRRMAWKKVLFNSAQIVISFAIAGGVLGLVADWNPLSGGPLSSGRDVVGGLAAVAVFYFSNQVLTGLARLLSSGASVAEIVQGISLEGRVEGMCLVVAPAVAAAAATHPLLIFLLLAPLAGFNMSVRFAMQNFKLEGERRKALDDQKTAEERFRSMIQNSSDVICLLDAEGKFIYVSPSVTPVLGYLPEDLLGMESQEIVHPDDVNGCAEAFTTVLRSPSGRTTGRWRVRTKGGDWMWTESTLQNMLGDPAVGGVVVNSRDISESRELEEQLRQSQKLEAIGRLAGGVAHDFNNLLSVIQNFAQFAKDELPEGTPVRDDLDEVLKAAARGAALNRQLLTFSRKEVIQPKVLAVNDVVSGIAQLLARTIHEDISLELSLGPVGRVEMDPTHLEQVLMNLAVNAKDAMPSGGTLKIETSVLRDHGEGAAGNDSSRGRDWLRLTLTDTGHGMEDETRQRIFEPFFTTKSRGAGTGLGLSTVYGIVQQAGGRIRVESKPGAGTTFVIDLPASDAVEPVREAEPEDSVERATETVLLVEDEEAVARLVERVLTGNGYRVLRAPSAEGALELVRDNGDEIDVLLTDVVMPGMSGRELVEAVSALGVEIEVLFMSGYAHDIVGRHGVLAEDENYLQKPFSGDELLRSIRSVIGAR